MNKYLLDSRNYEYLKRLTIQLKYGMKLIIPMTANLASAESMTESVSSSSGEGVIGNTSELRMHAPIATAIGASLASSALHLPIPNLLYDPERGTEYKNRDFHKQLQKIKMEFWDKHLIKASPEAAELVFVQGFKGLDERGV